MDRFSLSQPPAAEAEDRQVVNRLLVFFAVVYVVEGVGEVDGLIEQPLSFYLQEEHGWSARQLPQRLDLICELHAEVLVQALFM